jgi:hypothetical protein
MRTNGNNAVIAADPVDGADLIALTLQRLKELDRLRHLGFAQLERLNEATLALPPDTLLARMTGAKGKGET